MASMNEASVYPDPVAEKYVRWFNNLSVADMAKALDYLKRTPGPKAQYMFTKASQLAPELVDKAMKSKGNSKKALNAFVAFRCKYNVQVTQPRLMNLRLLYPLH